MKPENAFIQKVNKHLPRTVFAEKTNNPFRGGIPDVYYESWQGFLWVEYKFVEKLPKEYVPNLSALQLQWLRRAVSNNIPCCVITGIGKGRGAKGIIQPNEDRWEEKQHADDFFLWDPPGIANWIATHLRRKHIG